MFEGNAKSSGAEVMTNKTEQVSVPRELLERVLSYAWFPSGEVSVFDMRRIDREQSSAILAAPPEDVRAVVDGPLTDEGTMVQVLEPQKQKLLPPHTLLPHPPRHEGFLQPEREVPGYTLEQMKEYGALCAAEALRQNK